MRTWLALIIAPLLALADQSVSYATVRWACSHQQMLAIHATHALFLAAILVATLLAWQRFRETTPVAGEGEQVAGRHFLAQIATASGALSALVVIAMWFPVWVLTSCLG